MNYDQEILRVLCEAGGSGLSVHKISVHVHNACNSLFSPVEFTEVYRYVVSFLARNSRGSLSLVSRMQVRGRYRLNPNSARWSQLMLQFTDEDVSLEQEADNSDSADGCLSLF